MVVNSSSLTPFTSAPLRKDRRGGVRQLAALGYAGTVALTDSLIGPGLPALFHQPVI